MINHTIIQTIKINRVKNNIDDMGLLFRSSLCVWEEIFIMRGLYTVTEWIYRFAIVNLLWILFTIAGLVIFGFFPATLRIK